MELNVFSQNVFGEFSSITLRGPVYRIAFVITAPGTFGREDMRAKFNRIYCRINVLLFFFILLLVKRRGKITKVSEIERTPK